VAQCLLGHNFDLRYPGAYQRGEGAREWGGLGWGI
jgi:hypothetical protein